MKYRVLLLGKPTIPGDPMSAPRVNVLMQPEVEDYRQAWSEIRDLARKGGEFNEMVFDKTKHDPKNKDANNGWAETAKIVKVEPATFTVKHVYALEANRGFRKTVTAKQLLERAAEEKINVSPKLSELFEKMTAELEKEAEDKRSGKTAEAQAAA